MFQVSAHKPPKTVVHEIRHVFPGLIDRNGCKGVGPEGSERNGERRPVLVLCVAQRSELDLVQLTPEVAVEKDRLLEKLFAWCKLLCADLERRGYWADYIDPCSGLPFNLEGASKVWAEVEAFQSLLRWPVGNAGMCKVLHHPEWGTNVYPSSVFTDAPEAVLRAIFDGGFGAEVEEEEEEKEEGKEKGSDSEAQRKDEDLFAKLPPQPGLAWKVLQERGVECKALTRADLLLRNAGSGGLLSGLSGILSADGSNAKAAASAAASESARIRRIVCISDTHGYHGELSRKLETKEYRGDILLHCGDFSSTGKLRTVQDFCKWMGRQTQYEHRVVIAGNHETTADGPEYYANNHRRFHASNRQDDAAVRKLLRECPHFTYLEHGSVTVDGVKIFGSPWTPVFCKWAFNYSRHSGKAAELWRAIPDDADLVATHGPPIGYGDTCRPSLDRAGCVDLLRRLRKVRPQVHVFGHIHESYGAWSDDLGIKYINASTCNFHYKPINDPVVVDVVAGGGSGGAKKC